LISDAFFFLLPSPAWGHLSIHCNNMAQALKKKGNDFFVEGDYVSAEDYYSQA
jgi:hypothetical protein